MAKKMLSIDSKMFFQLVTYEVWKNRLGGRASSPEKGQVETQVQFNTYRQNIFSSQRDMFPLDGSKKQYFLHLALQVSHAMTGEGDGGGTRTVTKNLLNLL